MLPIPALIYYNNCEYPHSFQSQFINIYYIFQESWCFSIKGYVLIFILSGIGLVIASFMVEKIHIFFIFIFLCIWSWFANFIVKKVVGYKN